MLDWTDVVTRLISATVIGGAIGLDRDLRGKPTGVRTMGIVALGSALIVLATQYPSLNSDQGAVSRVLQGLITGIGFLGGGVILRNPEGGKVHGLTTAATIWLTACFGAACGVGAWSLIVTSSVLVTLILLFGRSIEKAFENTDGNDAQK